jgi:hypothetical protein
LDVISGQIDNKVVSADTEELTLDVEIVTPSSNLKNNIDFLVNQWNSREQIPTKISSETMETSEDSARNTPNFFVQTWLFFYRSLLIKFMDRKLTLLEMVYFCIPGLAMGAAGRVPRIFLC